MDQLTFTPPLSPRAMPEQTLDWRGPSAFPAGRPLRRPAARVRAARLTLAVVTLLGTVFAVTHMHAAANAGGMAALEWLLIAVFSVAFAWIAFSAGNAIAGVLFAPRLESGPPGEGEEDEDTGPTAIIMPIYNENPREVFAALAAMVADLPPNQRTVFEVFVLSDTTDPEIWIAEERAVTELRSLAGPTRVWYRRRRDNAQRKAGNVADFVRRWGGRYPHMVVLDADSLMTGACLVALRRAMIADPDAGIIQTAPVLIGATTPFARAQQFANTVVGPVVSRGIAAWQGEDGNYWGHNAIIRMAAFADAAGLPQLPGKAPFGGTILSHDFVEAALVRRAGWTVTMRPDLEGSYEGAPADLFGLIKRDRRWAQGNLQHARIIGAAGLRPLSRLHLFIGILSYLMSPAWLLLVLTGVALAVQATIIRPEYFPETFALFPTWPAFDSERMIWLFGASLLVLLLPKAIALGAALRDPALRRGAGGGPSLAGSALVELVVSTLVAPIMMMAQTGIVVSILLGRAVGWMPQSRRGGSVPWPTAVRFHLGHVLAGTVLAAVALLHSPTLAAWMSPMLIALVFAIPVSKAVASEHLGRRLRRAHILVTPQESAPPAIVRRARRLAHRFAEPLPDNALITLAADPQLCFAHLHALEPEERGRGTFDPDTALATAKLGEADSLEELAGWLGPSERLCLLSDTRLLDRALSLRGPGGNSAKAA